MGLFLGQVEIEDAVVVFMSQKEDQITAADPFGLHKIRRSEPCDRVEGGEREVSCDELLSYIVSPQKRIGFK